MEPSKKIYVGTAISKNCRKFGEKFIVYNLAYSWLCQQLIWFIYIDIYLFIYIQPGVFHRTEFSSVLLNKRPGHVTHLTGLLQLFKNRISNPLPVEISPVTCSVRFSYELEEGSIAFLLWILLNKYLIELSLFTVVIKHYKWFIWIPSIFKYSFTMLNKLTNQTYHDSWKEIIYIGNEVPRMFILSKFIVMDNVPMYQDWAEYYWSISPPDLDLYSVSGDTDFIQLRELQFGCVSDPVAGLNLHTTWRDLR